jgi:uncharacterized protein involved in type VI secretion and phage assembly
MAENLYGLLQKAHETAATGDAKMFGVEIAIVDDVKDPDKQGRVKVNFPRLNQAKSDWAPVMQPAGGSSRGFYWVPHVGDSVLVAFMRGESSHPVVIGSVWNGKDKPMEDAYSDENTTVMIQTRSGHKIVLDDKDGEEKIIIGDKSTKRTITFDVKEKKFLIEAAEGDIEIKAEKKIVLECEDLEIHTKKDGKITVDGEFNLKVTKDAKMESGPKMQLKARRVNIN